MSRLVVAGQQAPLDRNAGLAVAAASRPVPIAPTPAVRLETPAVAAARPVATADKVAADVAVEDATSGPAVGAAAFSPHGQLLVIAAVDTALHRRILRPLRQFLALPAVAAASLAALTVQAVAVTARARIAPQIRAVLQRPFDTVVDLAAKSEAASDPAPTRLGRHAIAAARYGPIWPLPEAYNLRLDFTPS